MGPWLGLLRSLVIYHNPATLRAWRRFYRGILQPGDICIDVGAHVGTRARAMRAVGGQVVAVEPQALFASYLRLTLPRDIVLVEAALGADQAMADMAVSSLHPTVSSLQTAFVDQAGDAPGFAHVRWDRQQRVSVTTLDQLISTHGTPRYIKIDVEGYELEVLSGLSRPVEMISVEYLPEFRGLSHAVIDRLEALGPYQFNPVAGERAGFTWPDWRNGASAREWLDGLPADAPSGDLFARLASS
ncbi:FkbM family methyltransferase [Sedimentitalea arenosa]|jgi:FkbM family methyltransferase|uniref:FkbM family methyltransferase n=1 Tax=Sedimentitalea arenosa TaxID=2798803 RepID=A0A8J7JJJ3_9RHOB|nr:FkbM family methyltransferase [Arenibacterium arenosum]MBJ6373579.1 FkbM family methyltransferase [Arenibacterium arenosum]